MPDSTDRKAGKVLKGLVSTAAITLVAVGGLWLSSGNEAVAVTDSSDPSSEVGQSAAELLYFEMEPLIVNVSSAGRQARFLKVAPVIVTQHPKLHEQLRVSEPVMRNALLSLYTRQNIDDLLSDGGFEELRVKSREVLQNTVSDRTGTLAVNDLLFTEFVVQ